LHVDEPTPYVDWSVGGVRLLTEERAWPVTDRPRRAGVSSFGVSGTNAHVILEEAPGDPVPVTPEPQPEPVDPPPLLLSARSTAALAVQAQRLRDHLVAHPGLALADAARALTSGRAQLRHRAAVRAADRAGVLAGLAALASGAPAPGVVRGTAATGPLAVVFPGQGAQRHGMGRDLYERHPAFRAALDELCAELARAGLAEPLREIMFHDGDPRLRLTAYAQPAIFAYEVALYRLLESFGVHAEVVVGHSVGELVAAHVAGALPLRDACRLVVTRAALMQQLPPGGAMAAVAAAEPEVGEVLGALGETGRRAGIAAVNGPTSVVVSGDDDAVDAVVREFTTRQRRTSRLAVSHAFHSAHMTPMLDAYGEVAAQLSIAAPELTMISTVTGGVVGRDELSDPAYWRRNVQDPVRFAAAVDAVRGIGVTAVLEVGPDAVLSAMVHETLDATDPATGHRPAVVSAVHVGPAAGETLLDALARLHTVGVAVDWRSVHGPGPAPAADLPTYPFQHERLRLTPRRPGAGHDVASAGLGAAEHPLLSAVLDLPDSGGAVLTGALSLHRQPWLADHALAGTALLPGTAVAELVVRAGDAVGCNRVHELILEAPLLVPADAVVALQVAVGAPEQDDRRRVQVFARTGGASGPWVRHASGVLGSSTPHRADGLTQWPPPDAEPVPVDGLHARIAERGLVYGPAFGGLRAAWRAAGELYLEAELPADAAQEADRFGLHPALFDAVLQGVALDTAEDAGVPFSFSGLTLHATGATVVRARLSAAPDGGISVTVADGAGGLVATVESLMLRPLGPHRPAPGGPDMGGALLGLDWVKPLTEVPAPPRREMWALVSAGDPDAGHRLATSGLIVVEDPEPIRALGHGVTRHGVVLVASTPAADAVPDAVQAECVRLLAVVQEWVTADVPAGSRLVVLTERAVSTRSDEDVVGLVGAAVRGMVRSAQAEHPDRFVLVDVDDVGTAAVLVPLATATALALGEPEVAVRDGAVLLPRLVPAAAAESSPGIECGGTVMVTGATGALGGLIARHLVTEHGVRHVLLVSRRGDSAPGAAALETDLARTGARIAWAACDVADPVALEAVLAAAEPAVTGIVHAAGALDDGVVTALTADRLAEVLRPKVDAAWTMHRLTRDRDLSMFVLFSSVAGTFGMPGQANYAAANAFLDALAQYRRARGLAALSVAWGLWDLADGMAARTGDARRPRPGRGGLGARQGLALFDRALGHDRAMLVAMGVDAAGPGAAAVPTLLRGLVRSRPIARAEARSAGELRDRLAAQGAAERQETLVDLVRSATAEVLGHADASAIADIDVFAELGLDSLMSVELRNVLAAATGIRLPTTLVFDHPALSGLARELGRQLAAELGDARPGRPDAPRDANDGDGDGTTLAALYRRASELGEYVDGTTMLQLAARFRPTFSTAAESNVKPELIRLCAGPANPPLICFPSPTVFGGPHEYTLLATVLRGVRDVWSPVYPGFVAGEHLPATFDALVDFLVTGVLERTAGGPCTIVGRSSGGTVAHLVAARLEELGAQVTSLVLLDTYPPGSSALGYILPVLQSTSLQAEGKVGPMTDVRLTAMAGYFSLFGEWSQKPVAAPTALFRASELVPSDEPPPTNEAHWRSSWPLEHVVVDVPGNHFTMMSDCVASTADQVEEWIRTRSDYSYEEWVSP
jgi:acyl transferase domain-containing protein/thioesterase domain-containing protein